MTLEAKVLATVIVSMNGSCDLREWGTWESNLRGILLVNILKSTPSFGTTNCPTRGIEVAGDNPRLVAERTQLTFEESGRIGEIDNVDIAFCGSNNEEPNIRGQYSSILPEGFHGV